MMCENVAPRGESGDGISSDMSSPADECMKTAIGLAASALKKGPVTLCSVLYHLISENNRLTEELNDVRNLLATVFHHCNSNEHLKFTSLNDKIIGLKPYSKDSNSHDASIVSETVNKTFLNREQIPIILTNCTKSVPETTPIYEDIAINSHSMLKTGVYFKSESNFPLHNSDKSDFNTSFNIQSLNSAPLSNCENDKYYNDHENDSAFYSFVKTSADANHVHIREPDNNNHILNHASNMQQEIPCQASSSSRIIVAQIHTPATIQQEDTKNVLAPSHLQSTIPDLPTALQQQYSDVNESDNSSTITDSSDAEEVDRSGFPLSGCLCFTCQSLLSLNATCPPLIKDVRGSLLGPQVNIDVLSGTFDDDHSRRGSASSVTIQPNLAASDAEAADSCSSIPDTVEATVVYFGHDRHTRRADPSTAAPVGVMATFPDGKERFVPFCLIMWTNDDTDPSTANDAIHSDDTKKLNAPMALHINENVQTLNNINEINNCNSMKNMLIGNNCSENNPTTSDCLNSVFSPDIKDTVDDNSCFNASQLSSGIHSLTSSNFTNSLRSSTGEFNRLELGGNSYRLENAKCESEHIESRIGKCEQSSHNLNGVTNLDSQDSVYCNNECTSQMGNCNDGIQPQLRTKRFYLRRSLSDASCASVISEASHNLDCLSLHADETELQLGVDALSYMSRSGSESVLKTKENFTDSGQWTDTGHDNDAFLSVESTTEEALQRGMIRRPSISYDNQTFLSVSSEMTPRTNITRPNMLKNTCKEVKVDFTDVSLYESSDSAISVSNSLQSGSWSTFSNNHNIKNCSEDDPQKAALSFREFASAARDFPNATPSFTTDASIEDAQKEFSSQAPQNSNNNRRPRPRRLSECIQMEDMADMDVFNNSSPAPFSPDSVSDSENLQTNFEYLQHQKFGEEQQRCVMVGGGSAHQNEIVSGKTENNDEVNSNSSTTSGLGVEAINRALNIFRRRNSTSSAEDYYSGRDVSHI